MILLLCCFACNNDTVKTEFDKTKWTMKGEEDDYTFRNEMVEDLMSNQGLKKSSKEEILELLGQPDRTDKEYLFYRIEQTRFLKFIPLHTKTMVINMSADSTGNAVMIHE